MQVVKSSSPFQLNCSTAATPNWSFSGSASSKSIGLPPLVMDLSAPSAGAEVPERLKKMFGKAVNRCQATPMVTWVEITITQAMDTAILIRASTLIAVGLSGMIAPNAWLTGAAHTGYGNASPAALLPRNSSPSTSTARMVYST